MASLTSRRLLSAALLGGSLVALSACDDTTPAPVAPPLQLATVNVTPRNKVLKVGETQQLSAEFVSSTVNAGGAAVVWRSLEPSVATVSDAGLVTAVSRGTTAISATIAGRTGVATIDVQAPVSTITIEGGAGTLAVGTTRQLNAIAKDAAGNLAPGRAVTWTSSNPAAIAITPNGLITGVSEGTSTITATAEGRSGTLALEAAVLAASISIEPTPAIMTANTQQLTARVRDGQGNVINRPVTWTSNAESVISVNGSGLATRNANGCATITAQHSTFTARVDLFNPPVAGTVLLNNGTAVNVAGTVGSFVYYFVCVPSNATQLVVQMAGGTGDGDIYVFRPGASSAACAPFLNGNNETCTFTTNVSQGLWIVGLEAFTTFAGATLRATVTVP